ncbi:MAG: hypothetical protein HND47_19785 [Chloroflexi bacterium]|nr:hypothetical protein [Chloroflexota bacterium]
MKASFGNERDNFSQLFLAQAYRLKQGFRGEYKQRPELTIAKSTTEGCGRRISAEKSREMTSVALLPAALQNGWVDVPDYEVNSNQYKFEE